MWPNSPQAKHGPSWRGSMWGANGCHGYGATCGTKVPTGGRYEDAPAAPGACWPVRPLATAHVGTFLFRLAALRSAAFSTFSSLFLSSESSASSSAVYSETIPHSNFERSAILMSFNCSATSFAPCSRKRCACSTAGEVAPVDSSLSSASASATTSATRSTNVACSSLSFFRKA